MTIRGTTMCIAMAGEDVQKTVTEMIYNASNKSSKKASKQNDYIYISSPEKVGVNYERIYKV